MQGTAAFKTVISDHLLNLAISDPLFAETLNKPGKNIDDCTTYILNQVKASGQNGFADAEIFGMAVHYYDEDNIEVGKPVSGRVVVNHHIEAPAKKSDKQPTKGEVNTEPQVASKKPATKKLIIENQQSLF
jgi:hypothetical protein